MKPSEALNCAADVVMNGWGRDGYALNATNTRVHIMADEAVTFCAVGATARVLGGSTGAADAILDVWVVPLLPPLMGPHQRTVRRWNDDFAKTKEEVANMLRAGADMAKLKGE